MTCHLYFLRTGGCRCEPRCAVHSRPFGLLLPIPTYLKSVPIRPNAAQSACPSHPSKAPLCGRFAGRETSKPKPAALWVRLRRPNDWFVIRTSPTRPRARAGDLGWLRATGRSCSPASQLKETVSAPSGHQSPRSGAPTARGVFINSLGSSVQFYSEEKSKKIIRFRGRRTSINRIIRDTNMALFRAV